MGESCKDNRLIKIIAFKDNNSSFAAAFTAKEDLLKYAILGLVGQQISGEKMRAGAVNT